MKYNRKRRIRSELQHRHDELTATSEGEEALAQTELDVPTVRPAAWPASWKTSVHVERTEEVVVFSIGGLWRWGRRKKRGEEPSSISSLTLHSMTVARLVQLGPGLSPLQDTMVLFGIDIESDGCLGLLDDDLLGLTLLALELERLTPLQLYLTWLHQLDLQPDTVDNSHSLLKMPASLGSRHRDLHYGLPLTA
ncbi:hypothetical protein INR49_017856 [Caranx melampygus]|nr:hypothetical protein INR49_017856 [Caranx melampygus]